MSPWLFVLQQRCVWWTAVPTARASVVCVTAKKAGQDQNVSRGTVTHAASTTESVARASVTATRAGRENTAPLVSRDDTCSTVHLHTLDRRARTTEEIHLWAGLKGHLWSVNVRIFSAVSSICWIIPTCSKQIPLHNILVISTSCWYFQCLEGSCCFLPLSFLSNIVTILLLLNVDQSHTEEEIK